MALEANAAPALVDALVVGGGINGCGIARDLAGRGHSVLLAEQDDLGAHTSSSSSKLIHGGLRYLEHREFGLVRKALQEREVLMRSAPHLMRPLRFVMPHNASMRPAWLIRLGLFLYDHLAKREWLEGSAPLALSHSRLGAPLQACYTQGFVYSDGWVDDARLTLHNALDARARGARILTHTRCALAQRNADHWHATLQLPNGSTQMIRARVLVNAAGPWASNFLHEHARSAQGERLATRKLRLVKGSHIVVRRHFDHDHAYIFQNPDGRILFAIPFERDFTLIGTTDTEIHGDPVQAHADEREIAYLCEQANRYFAHALSPADVLWSYSGVRPLLDDASGNPAAVTRDYLLEHDTQAAAMLTVWGGKITTFRQLAQDASDWVSAALGSPRPAWTRTARLPGGDLGDWIEESRRPDLDFDRFLLALRQRHPWLPLALAERWARAYGSRVGRVLADARRLSDLGQEVAPGLYEAELRYLQDEEWAQSAQDILWRRSKLGLHLSATQQAAVTAWVAQAN